jgi:hypothetical protein
MLYPAAPFAAVQVSETTCAPIKMSGAVVIEKIPPHFAAMEKE